MIGTRVLCVEHQPDAGPGVFARAAQDFGAELVRWRPPDEPPPALDHQAVLALGGAAHPDSDGANPWLEGERALLRDAIDRGLPVLGVCLGAQLLAQAVGGSAARSRTPEIGWREVALEAPAAADPLLGGAPPRFASFQWHSYEIGLPPGATVLARSELCLQAYRLPGPAWGIQFHAEVDLPTAEHWIDDYAKDEDAVRSGLDPEAFRAATRTAIADWNTLGEDIFRRFLSEAARRA